MGEKKGDTGLIYGDHGKSKALSHAENRGAAVENRCCPIIPSRRRRLDQLSSLAIIEADETIHSSFPR